MAREAERVSIDNFDYKIKPLSTSKSLKVLSRLSKIFGGPIGEALKNGDGLMDKDISDALPIIGTAVHALAERLDEDIVLNTVKDLLEGVTIVNGDKERPVNNVFEVHFEGNIFSLLKLVKSSLEVNYSDFFAGVTGLKDKLGKAMKATD